MLIESVILGLFNNTSRIQILNIACRKLVNLE